MAIGNNVEVYLGLQADKDTLATDFIKLEATSASMLDNVDTIVSDALTGNRFKTDADVVSIYPDGDVDIELTKAALPFYLLMAGFEEKEDPVINGDKFDHEFKGENLLSRWGTVVLNQTDENMFKVFRGVRVNTLGVNATQKAYITLSASTNGLEGNTIDGVFDETNYGEAFTILDVDNTRILSLDATVTLGLEDVTGIIDEVSFNVNNNLDTDDYAINSVTRRDLIAQASDSDLSATTQFEKSTYFANRDLLETGTYTSLTLQLTDDISIVAPKVLLTEVSDPIDGPDKITVSIAANVLFDDVENTALKFVVTDETATKY